MVETFALCALACGIMLGMMFDQMSSRNPVNAFTCGVMAVLFAGVSLYAAVSMGWVR